MFERISVDPQIHFGKPCVKGTRIKVLDVLELVNEGVNCDKISSEYYPRLIVEDVHAYIEYAVTSIVSEDFNTIDN